MRNSDNTPRMPCTKSPIARQIPLERQEQRALVAWFKHQYPTELMFSIPNGLVRGRLGALNAAIDGLVAGIPDLCVAAPRKGLHGLYIELKSLSGKPSPSQLRMIDLLLDKGYLATICYGFDEARNVITEYMNG